MALTNGFNPFLDALGGTPWANTHVITFFFDNGGAGGAWTPAEQAQFWDAARTWSSVADIRFLEVDNAAAANLVERKVTNTELPPAADGTLTLASHGTPGAPTHVGQFNTQTFWTPAAMQTGGYTFETFVHELGHAIGLAHPHDNGQGTGVFPGVNVSTDLGNNNLNTTINTIMSYNDPRTVTNANAGSGWIATPMAFDIATIQLMYGAVRSNDGDTVYTLPDANQAGTFYSSIWDTSGIDTIQYNGAKDSTIDLRPAYLGNGVGGGGFLSSANGVQGGFTIAADITGFIPDQNGVWGVIIENAIGGSGNDTIYGNDVDNVLRGGAGNDVINGFGGNDAMLGGIGDDVYIVDQAGDTVYDEAGAAGGVDKIYTSLNSYNLSNASKGLYVENLQFVGKGNFVGTGNALDNALVGAAGNDTLNGGAGNDALVGGLGADTLIGGAGNDWLNGEAGADTMSGGKGNDTYVVDNINDVVDEEEVTGGAGGGILGALRLPYADAGSSHDLVQTSLSRYDLSAGTSHNSVLGGSGKLFGVVEDLTYTGTGNFIGIGNSANNIIRGGAGRDSLQGNGGNDTLIGGRNADTMYGGAGNDTYYVDNAGDVVDEQVYRGTGTGGSLLLPYADAGSTNDTVITTLATYDLSNTGSHNLFGLAAKPIYGVIENLTFNGAGKFTGTGNSAANIITGGAGNDTLSGLAGNDTLIGGSGEDTLEGGAGNDFLIGGDRFDTFVMRGAVGGLGIDRIEGGSADGLVDTYNDRLDFSGLAGRVTVDLAGGHFTATDDVATVTSNIHGIEYVIGSAFDDIFIGTADENELVGGGGNDTLRGGAGQDFLSGGLGVDSFVFDTGWGDDGIIDFENGAELLDMRLVAGLASFDQFTVTYFGVGDRSVASVFFDGNSISLSGIKEGDLTAADFWFSGQMDPRNHFVGDDGANTLIGNGADNLLEGLGGDDTLIGLAGADILDGGTGVDTADYSASTAGVTVNLATGVGSGGEAQGDTLISIEHAIGSAFNDTFVGGADRGNFLGGDGNDTMTGGSVFDWFEGGNGNDTFIGTGGQMVMFGGDGDDTMTGSLDNTNYFAGGFGNDVMIGGNTTDYISDVDGGDDIMHGGGGADTLVDYYGANQLYGEDGDDFVTSVGSGSYLDGGAGNDYISVANGDYTLVGGDGIDTLEAAGHGSVIFTGGGDADIFTYRIASNGPLSYTVTDFEDGVDSILLWDNKYYGDVNPNLGFDSLAITDSAAGAVISWNGTSEMTLAGMTADQITAADFLLA